MKIYSLIVGVLLLAAGSVYGQERVDAARTNQISILLSITAQNTVKDPNVKTEVDFLKGYAMNKGDQVVLVIPDKNLTKEAVEKTGGKGVLPVGQLWLRDVVPQIGEKGASNDQLRFVKVELGKESLEAQLSYLALGRDDKAEPMLLVFGKGKEPLLKQKLEVNESKQELPIELELVAPEEKPLELTLKLFGKYRAKIPLVSAKMSK